MPKYDAEQFDPPAPVALVTLSNPVTGASLSDVPMLMDTGADVTLVSSLYIDKLGISSSGEKVYQLQDFEGHIVQAKAVLLELAFLGKKFKGQFLLTDQPIGVLGRNILNTIRILLDGPGGLWEEYKR